MKTERCEAILNGMTLCPKMGTDTYRTKAASGSLYDFRLCPEHRIAWDRADQEQRAQKARMRARAAFVKAWREWNTVEVWGIPWTCPLCNRAVQDFYLPAHMAQIESHQQTHGQDWLDYQAIDARADREP